MTTIGLIAAGAMGSALGASWIAGGARVITDLTARSERTRTLATDSGLSPAADLAEVLSADVVVSVVPPGEAIAVATDIATVSNQTGRRPLVVDLNAVSPSTMDQVVECLSGLDVVDGSISGGPPRAGSTPTRVYLSGARAQEFAEIASALTETVVLGAKVGTASALKMCTASMYKGTKALIMQAMLTAGHFGVEQEFLADVSRQWPEEVPGRPGEVAVAAAKGWRFVEEMNQIAATQAEAGLPPELFTGIAASYQRAAGTQLGRTVLEDIDRNMTVGELLDKLR